MINWPSPLIRELESRNVILVLGAGFSASAKNSAGATLPTWRELLQRGVQRLGKASTKHITAKINSSEFLLACDLLKRALDDD